MSELTDALKSSQITDGGVILDRTNAYIRIDLHKGQFDEILIDGCLGRDDEDELAEWLKENI